MDIRNIIKETVNEVFMKDNHWAKQKKEAEAALKAAKRGVKEARVGEALSTADSPTIDPKTGKVTRGNVYEEAAKAGIDPTGARRPKRPSSTKVDPKDRKDVREALGSADTPQIGRKNVYQEAREAGITKPKPRKLKTYGEAPFGSGSSRSRSAEARGELKRGSSETQGIVYRPQAKSGRKSPKGFDSQSVSNLAAQRPRVKPGKTTTGGAKQNLLARRGQQGTPTKLGDIPKGKPEKLGKITGTGGPQKLTGSKPTPPKTTLQTLGNAARRKLNTPQGGAPKATAPRPGSAAASLAANRKEIGRRTAARKLGSGSASRMTEGA